MTTVSALKISVPTDGLGFQDVSGFHPKTLNPKPSKGGRGLGSRLEGCGLGFGLWGLGFRVWGWASHGAWTCYYTKMGSNIMSGLGFRCYIKVFLDFRNDYHHTGGWCHKVPWS